jgi:hypothetical protein
MLLDGKSDSGQLLGGADCVGGGGGKDCTLPTGGHNDTHPDQQPQEKSFLEGEGTVLPSTEQPLDEGAVQAERRRNPLHVQPGGDDLAGAGGQPAHTGGASSAGCDGADSASCAVAAVNGEEVPATSETFSTSGGGGGVISSGSGSLKREGGDGVDGVNCAAPVVFELPPVQLNAMLLSEEMLAAVEGGAASKPKSGNLFDVFKQVTRL